jgi:hypothetical protein
VLEDDVVLEDLTAIFHFDVERLYVRSDQLGSEISTHQAGYLVHIVLPNLSGRFPTPDLPSPRFFPLAEIRSLPDGPEIIQVVSVVQVRVALHESLGDEVPGNAGSALLHKAKPVAAAALRHMGPEPYGEAYLMNTAGEVSQPYWIHDHVSIVHPDGGPQGDFSGSVLDTIVPEGQSLLAEARWAVWPTRDPDTKRAVLLSAIALEVRVPEVLQAKAPPRVRTLLGTFYSRPDDASMAVNFQVNDLASAVLGQSLKEYDGRLAKRVRALFRVRNDIVHRGRTPAPDVALDAVDAAELTFAWLDGLSVSTENTET